MPARKSNVSAVSNAAEEAVESAPVRTAKDKDGLSVDVKAHEHRPPGEVTDMRRPGPQPSKINDRSSGQGRLTTEYSNSQGRLIGATQKCHSFRELHRFKVCTFRCRGPKELLLIYPVSSNDNAQAAGKKTISPQDVIAALKDAEFEGFVPRLEAELKSKPFPCERHLKPHRCAAYAL
jgi:hypothetical protein